MYPQVLGVAFHIYHLELWSSLPAAPVDWEADKPSLHTVLCLNSSDPEFVKGLCYAVKFWDGLLGSNSKKYTLFCRLNVDETICAFS